MGAYQRICIWMEDYQGSQGQRQAMANCLWTSLVMKTVWVHYKSSVTWRQKKSKAIVFLKNEKYANGERKVTWCLEDSLVADLNQWERHCLKFHVIKEERCCSADFFFSFESSVRLQICCQGYSIVFRILKQSTVVFELPMAMTGLQVLIKEKWWFGWGGLTSDS